MTRRLAAMALALGLMTGIAARAEAAPITGSITFSGGLAAMDFTTGTSIDMTSALVDCAVLNTCGGSYAVLNGQIIKDPTLTYNDFTFDPLPGPYVPLWSFTFGGLTYSFDLLTATVDSRSDTGIVLSGTGTAHITGFDDTPSIWSFSANQTGVYSFSSTNAVPTPDGASTLLLLGGGLVTAAGFRWGNRRR